MKKKMFRRIPISLLAAAIMAAVVLVVPVNAAFGDPDTTFGVYGTTVFHSSGVEARSLIRQPDGKFIAVGHHPNSSADSTYYLLVRRYNSNGSLDTSFGNNGNAIPYNVYGRAWCIALQSDGKILVGGGSGGSATYVWRFNANGWYDSGFGSNGRASLGSSFNGVRRIAAMKTNSLSLVESIIVGYNGDTIKRLNSNGSVNTSFGQNGAISISDEFVTQNATASESALIVTANLFYGSVILRGYDANGQSDNGFGVKIGNYGLMNQSYLRGLARTSQGKLVVWGWSCAPGGDVGCFSYPGFVGVHSAEGNLENNIVTQDMISPVRSNPDGTHIATWLYNEPVKKLSSNLVVLASSDGPHCNDLFIQPDSRVVCATNNGYIKRFLQ